MGVCSFTSLRYFQCFIALQRQIQTKTPCQSKSDLWVQPWKCLFSSSHAFMRWLPWECMNAGFGTGHSSHPADHCAQQSCLLPEQAWWPSHVSGCRCVSTLLTSVYPPQLETLGGSGLHGPGNFIHRGSGISFCLCNTCEKWKLKNFVVFRWCTYVTMGMCTAE